MNRVQFAPRALLDASRFDAWWRANRTDAPSMFWEELVQMVALLAVAPGIGAAYRETRGRQIRRLFLRRSKRHAYYWHDEATRTVQIVAIWGAQRGKNPRL